MPILFLYAMGCFIRCSKELIHLFHVQSPEVYEHCHSSSSSHNEPEVRLQALGQ